MVFLGNELHALHSKTMEPGLGLLGGGGQAVFQLDPAGEII